MIYAAAYRPEGRKCDRFREHILGRRLLEWGLLQEYGRTWEVIAPENGKPFLKDSPGVFFSISHTEGMAVCAVCSHPVGIDIQIRKPCSKGLVRRICSPEEYSWICEKQEKEAEKAVLRLWTLKESYAKADGRGLAFPFRQISFANRLEREPERIFYGTASFALPLDLGDRHGFTADIPGWRFFEAQLGDAYHIGGCMRDTDPDKKGAAG